MRERNVWKFSSALAVLIFAAAPAIAQDTHGGGESGCGDLFGDLVHLLRDAGTGVPILQKREVLVSGPCDPATQDCYETAYCPIALGASGQPLRFLPESCDVDLGTGTPVAVDYFGRLSMGRTKERNIRMHFDEVIDKIKGSEAVWRDASGRLALGLGCTSVGPTAAICTEWSVVDAPPENLALYTRLMKYGHFQTDPAEVDAWAKGDPALGPQYHPALEASDHAKFVGEARALLPGTSGCPGAGTDCFSPETLETGDFLAAASFLATAADKTGRATVDLVHYLNRILKIPVATPHSAPTKDVLFALYRDCGAEPDAQPDTPGCSIQAADASLPAPANERFVDFGALSYDRAGRFAYTVEAIRPASTLGLPRLVALEALLSHPVTDVWVVEATVPLLDWLLVRNGSGGSGQSVDGFVRATNDALRSIEFVHNYAVPADLGWDFNVP